MSVRTRFAPSPTGYLHIGGIRTALFSWLYARHHGGEFVLRIEDTDRERSTTEATDIILEGMQWLGLDYDEGPYYQTQRFDRYGEVIRELLENDRAYHCYCTREELDEMRSAAMARGEKPKYDGRCRERTNKPAADLKPTVRFKNPLEGEVIVEDLIQGRVIYRNNELDDLIIARADGTPTYNLTVVVDDIDMRITHVIRGDDHLNNTPRQMNIFDALDRPRPLYAHVPMILGTGRKKLSKRDVNTVSVLLYRDEGILPEALLNYLVRLGWSHGDQEIFSRDEMIHLFDITEVNKAAAALDQDKLLWLNQHYLKTAELDRVTKLLQEFMEKSGFDSSNGPPLIDMAEVQRQRCRTLKDIVEQSHYFYSDIDSYDEGAAKKHLRPVIFGPLDELRNRLTQAAAWDNDSIHAAINIVAEKHEMKMGKIAQPLRVAITGASVSPSIDDTVRLLGREKTLARLDRALEYIKHRPATS